MKKIKQVMGLLRLNWKVMVLFEIVYKLVTATVMLRLVEAFLHLSMHVSGYNYITSDNVIRWLFHPFTIVLIILIIMSLAAISLFDIGAILYVVDASMEKQRVRLPDVFRFAAKNSLRVFKPGNFLLILLVLVMLPFVNIGGAPGMITSIAVPGFVKKYIFSHWWFIIIYFAGLFLVFWIIMKWLYAMHYFTIEKCTFQEARKKSRILHQGKIWKDAATLILLQVFFIVVFAAVIALIVLVAVLVGRIAGTKSLAYSMVFSAVFMACTVISIVYMCLSIPLNYYCISVLFYSHKQSIGEEIVHIPGKELPKKSSRRFWKVVLVLTLISGILMSAFVYMVTHHKININIENVRTVEISAHRGDSSNYPENTMAAFQGAVDLGADWIELDVQLTKDGVPVIMHDSSLKRTTGIKKDIWEVTYDEIKDLDNGSWFDEKFSDQRIPTLQEVLDFASERLIRLDIELKPTGHEENFAKIVMQMINDSGYQDYCAISSMNNDILKEVKTLDENMMTISILTVAMGNIQKMTWADAFCVETSFISDSLVSSVHSAGKTLFVWTVDDWTGITKMINYGVDNIVTNKVTRAKTLVGESRTSTLLSRYISYMLQIFYNGNVATVG